MNSDIEPLDVEGLEKDFCGLLAILGRVERRFSLISGAKISDKWYTQEVRLTKRK